MGALGRIKHKLSYNTYNSHLDLLNVWTSENCYMVEEHA